MDASQESLTAEFSFVGAFRYRNEEQFRLAISQLELEPAPIPPHIVEIDGLTVRLDYRTSSMPDEWSRHLVSASQLALHAAEGELYCTYMGPSATGHRVQLVRLTPKGGEVCC